MIPLEQKKQLQFDAGIPHLPTDLTYECRMAISGEGNRAQDWSDKPHRLVYDLSRQVEADAVRIAELERKRVLDDGRPCVTDVFLAAAIEQLDDKWDFFEAVKCWCEGDWEGAFEGIELEGK